MNKQRNNQIVNDFSIYVNLIVKCIFCLKKDTYHPDIIVVSDKTDLSSAETSRFQYIPLFYPILKSSIGLKDDNLQVEINSSEVNIS